MTCPQPEKQRHASRRAAEKALVSLEAARGIDLGLRPYRCGDHWHLGHRHKGLTFEKWDRKMRRRALRRNQ